MDNWMNSRSGAITCDLRVRSRVFRCRSFLVLPYLDYANRPDLNIRPPKDREQFFVSEISFDRVADPLVSEQTFVL